MLLLLPLLLLLYRLMKTPGKSQAEMDAAIARRPSSLSSTINLGVVDFYPAASGKEGAAEHIMRRMGVDRARTAFLCDDDNDLVLAARVGKAFLPSISAVRVCVWGGGEFACSTCNCATAAVAQLL